jgi:hypothetical protein
MRIKLQIATADDVAELVSLRTAVSQRLTSQYGKGYWSAGSAKNGALFATRISQVYIARYRKRLIATLTPSTRKPWAI